MIRKEYLLILICALLVGSLGAGVALNDFYKANAPHTCEAFIHAGYIWLPQSVSSLFMDDSIILHFTTIYDDHITVYGIVNDHGIFDLSCKAFLKPDAEVSMSDLMAIELATSTKPITTFVTGWRNGRIEIKTYNLATQKKLAYGDQLMANDFEPVPPVIRAIFDRFLSNSNSSG